MRPDVGGRSPAVAGGDVDSPPRESDPVAAAPSEEAAAADSNASPAVAAPAVTEQRALQRPADVARPAADVAQPPADVAAIVAKMVAFIQVRPRPLPRGVGLAKGCEEVGGAARKPRGAACKAGLMRALLALPER